MKRNVTLFLLIFLTVAIHAQIPNGNFETWTTVTNDWHLSYYRHSNYENETLQKYQPAQHGNYAVRLKSKASSQTPGSIESGMLSNTFNPQPLNGGKPYSQKPTKFYVYAQYDIKSGDAASIGVIFKKNGSVISANLLDCIFPITGIHTGDYQKLEFDIKGLSETPDEVVIIASSEDLRNKVSSTSFSTPQAGSYIIIDNMSFDTSDPIPYGDFEEWGRPVEQPSNFIMKLANGTIVDYDIANPMQKTTDSHSGTYALKATTWFNPDWGNGVDDKGTPCFWGINGNYPSDNQQTTFACTRQNGKFTGWYKYIPTSTDNAFIKITFYKNGAEISSAQKDLAAASVYTRFSVPFNCPETPDAASINFNTSSSSLAQNVGSALYLDDLALESFTTGVSDNKSSLVDISMNQMTGSLQINGVTETLLLTIYDLSGKQVKQTSILGDSSVSLSALSKGIYIVRVTGDNVMATTKINKE